jgi:glycosyltransferase involved in cell wall biosynthesis
MSRPLSIAHLIKGLGRGGAEGLLPQVVRYGGAGFSYRAGYFLPHKDALAGELASAGAPVRCFGGRSAAGLLVRVPRVATWLRDERVDLLHCHLPLAGVVGRLAARLARVPVVYSEHNVIERYHPLTRRAHAATWRLQAAVVAVSEEVAASVRRTMGEAVPVRVVRNGIDVERMAATAEEVASARAELGVAGSAPLVGTVAVLREQKRLDLWLAAARTVADALPAARFAIVGDGPLRGELEAEAARLGIAGRVTFTGLRPDVRAYHHAFDLFLASSQFEGLPLALLEAMAAGRPVVATRVGGVPEAVDDGVEGLLVPPGDPAALAAAALSLLADPARARALAAAARRRVAADFGVARMARELELLYAEVLGR